MNYKTAQLPKMFQEEKNSEGDFRISNMCSVVAAVETLNMKLFEAIDLLSIFLTLEMKFSPLVY